MDCRWLLLFLHLSTFHLAGTTFWFSLFRFSSADHVIYWSSTSKGCYYTYNGMKWMFTWFASRFSEPTDWRRVHILLLSTHASSDAFLVISPAKQADVTGCLDSSASSATQMESCPPAPYFLAIPSTTAKCFSTVNSLRLDQQVPLALTHRPDSRVTFFRFCSSPVLCFRRNRCRWEVWCKVHRCRFFTEWLLIGRMWWKRALRVVADLFTCHHLWLVSYQLHLEGTEVHCGRKNFALLMWRDFVRSTVQLIDCSTCWFILCYRVTKNTVTWTKLVRRTEIEIEAVAFNQANERSRTQHFRQTSATCIEQLSFKRLAICSSFGLTLV